MRLHAQLLELPALAREPVAHSAGTSKSILPAESVAGSPEAVLKAECEKTRLGGRALLLQAGKSAVQSAVQSSVPTRVLEFSPGRDLLTGRTLDRAHRDVLRAGGGGRESLPARDSVTRHLALAFRPS